MLGNSTEKDSVPVSMTLHAENLREISVTTNVRKFSIVDIVRECRDAALKGRFEHKIDIDLGERDQRDLLRTLEHYGYAVTVVKPLDEGQNTFYIKW